MITNGTLITFILIITFLTNKYNLAFKNKKGDTADDTEKEN